MAELVGAGLAYAFGAGAGTVAASAAVTAFTVAGVAVTYGAIGAVVLAGAAVAYSSAQTAKLRKSLNAAAFQDSSRTVMVRDPVAARRKIYGEIKTSGMMYPVGVSGDKNQHFHFAVIYASHEVEELGDLYLGDELVPLDGSGNATGRFAGFVKVVGHRGEPGQAADAGFAAAMPSAWTSAHIGNGIAYDAVTLTVSPDLFPSGLPTVRRMIKGAKVYDPRDSGQDPDDSTTWEFSQNAALCVADQLHDRVFGKGVSWSRIDIPALIESANICDEDVVLA